MSLRLAGAVSDFLEEIAVPESLVAKSPPESRGLARDEVRLMVSKPEGISHHTFAELPVAMESGDLVVVNNSSTLPASVVVDDDLVFHFSTEQPGGFVVVEPRRLSGFASVRKPDIGPGRYPVPGGGAVDLIAPFPVGASARRLWLAAVDVGLPLGEYLSSHGRPIRYGHVDGPHPLDAYQTIFASVPGSAEMPSAGRPFSGRLLAALAASGVSVAPITLHTGVSSLEAGELPYPERFAVPESTAALINHVKANDGKVIAVGTTVVRALETAADRFGRVHPADSLTDLVVGSGHTLRIVDGLITGWHEAESTHLEMLEAVIGRVRLSAAYEAAVTHEYLWHEFGDSLLMTRS